VVPTNVPVVRSLPPSYGSLLELIVFLVRAGNVAPLRKIMDAREERDDEMSKRERAWERKHKELKSASRHESPWTLAQPQALTYEATAAECELLLGRQYQLVARIIREDVAPDSMAELLAYLAWESRSFSKHFLTLARDGLLAAKYGEFRPYLKALAALQNVRDYLQPMRVSLSCEIIYETMDANLNSKDVCELLAEWVLKAQADRNEEVRVWVSKNRDLLISKLRTAQERHRDRTAAH